MGTAKWRWGVWLLALVGCGDNLSGASDGSEPLGRWEPLPAFGLQGRGDHSAVWTGRDVIAWGGEHDPTRPYNDGVRYTPLTGAWEIALAAGLEERDDHAAVWTGAEMLVWGGNSYDEAIDLNLLDDGGGYDPATGTWRVLPFSVLAARDDPRAVWTGREMIIWGGRTSSGQSATGARFDPISNTWQRVSMVGAPMPREDHAAVWTGTEMLIFGGWKGNGFDTARDYDLDAARYDPNTDTWRAMSLTGAPQPREDHDALWTGTEMLIWGGVVRTASGRAQVATGGLYDPASDSWRPTALAGAPEAREDDVAVWTGTEMIVWGGKHLGVVLNTGGRYDPATDRWGSMTIEGAPTARRNHAGVWAGDRLVLWSGKIGSGLPVPDGGAYFP